MANRTANRLNNFTDAAFALALSLLVVTGTANADDADPYISLVYQVPAYLFTFAIIANFWYAHVRWSNRDGAMNGISILATLTLIFIVLIFVYPLRELTTLGISALFGAEQSFEVGFKTAQMMIIFYGCGFAGLAASLAILNRNSLKLGLLTDDDQVDAKDDYVIWAGISAIGLVSVVLALIPPAIWFAMWVYTLIPVFVAIYSFRQSKLKKMNEPSDDSEIQD